MEKLLEKYHLANSRSGIVSGLLAAQALCGRRLIQCDSNIERDAILKVMEDIINLMEQAQDVD